MPRTPRGITGRPATEIAHAVRSGEVTAVAVTRAHLARIAEKDPAVGAFQQVSAERALAEAAAVDAHPRRGELPLAGVPVAIKDNVDVAGLPTLFGSAATGREPAPADDELVRRLVDAGAVVIGKTRLPELAIWPFAEGAFGATRNPWDLARTPGGSSSGAAAAVASGMAALALGSDGAGSIRIPAACCGVFGLKPAPGVVPLPGGAADHWLGMSAFGPIARSVGDAAAMLAVLAGTAARPAPDRRLRVALSFRPPTPGARIGAAVRGALLATARVLTAAGHELREADPPYPTDLALRVLRRYLPGIAEDAVSVLEDFDAAERRTQGMARVGAAMRSAGLAAHVDRDAAGARLREWLGGYDALLSPVLATPAAAIGTWAGRNWVRTLVKVSGWVQTPVWNLAGVPAASVPAGRDAAGLPLAVQLVGARGGEATLLRLAADIEARQPWRLDRARD